MKIGPCERRRRRKKVAKAKQLLELLRWKIVYLKQEEARVERAELWRRNPTFATQLEVWESEWTNSFAQALDDVVLYGSSPLRSVYD